MQPSDTARTFGLALLALLPPLLLAAGQWRVVGPGGGGAQFQPVLSRLDPRLAAVTTDMNAGFISEDLGETWRMFNLRARPKTVLFDPLDRDAIWTLLPGRLGLYRSGDRGRSWHLVYPPASAVERLIYHEDEAEIAVTTRGNLPPLVAFDLDPARPGVIYAARGAQLEVSEDGGRTWRALGRLDGRPINGNGRSLFIDPDSAPAARGVAVVESGKVEFWSGGRFRSSSPPGVTRIREAAAGSAPSSLYLLTEPPGLWVTRDRGQSWRNLSPGLAALSFLGRTLPELRGLATSAQHAEHVYVSYSRLPTWFQWLFGVARSQDGGQTWKLVWSDGRWPDRRVHDNWLNAALGPAWGENPLEIAVSPNNPGVVFASDLGRTMRTTDGGGTWEGVYSRSGRAGSWTSRGLDMTTSYGVHVDPFDPRRLFISYTDIGLFGSEDGGASWRPSGQGIPREWSNSTYWVETDPDVSGRMWAATAGVHDLPRMKMVRRWRPEQNRWHGGICASRDGGRTWSRSNTGLPDLPVTHVLVDAARSRPGARTLYAAVFGGGVYKSTDDGATWSAQLTGIRSGARPLVWRLALDRNGVLYAVVTRRREALEFGDPDTDGAVYRSSNGAATWERLPLPSGLNGPHGLAIDPVDPRRLYLAAFGRFLPDVAQTPLQGGIHLSEDGGRTWRAVHGRDQYIYDVTIDPRRPHVLYATGYQSSLWRSSDRGLSWRRVPGFNVKNAHRALADPRHPGMIFVTTYGSSVWYGPDTGDPDSLEDIATPEVSYSRVAGEK